MSSEQVVAHSAFMEFCRAGLWPGVGPAIADQLQEAGIDSREGLSEEVLAALPRVTDKRARRLFTAWIGVGHVYEVATLLAPAALPVRWSSRLVDYWGDGAAAVLVADPWSLMALPECGVGQADAFARAVEPTVSATDPRRLRALVTRALMSFARDGHTAAPVDLVIDSLRADGITAAADGAAAVEAALEAEGAVTVADPTGHGEPWLAAADLASAENALAVHLRRLADGASPLATAAQVREVIDNLDTTQAKAVAAAADNGVSILTGGPGTGKSRTVTAVVELCTRQGLSVALAAPTGRAAKRLAELLTDHASTAAARAEGSIADQAMTIHRLLGARKGSGKVRSVFEHDEGNPIEADLVVVDETSMLDVELGAALLAAIPTGAHLVLVGDPAQLPSIGAGQVLSDIVSAGRFVVTDLTTLYRHSEGGAIARLAAAARDGALIAVDSTAGASPEVAIVPALDSLIAQRRVVQLVTDSIPRVFGATGDELQVITPVHRGPAGTIALNQALKAALNPGAGRVRGFDVGDRVVATANHLDAEPFGYANGEVGTVIEAAGKDLMVDFPGGPAEVSGKAIGDLAHGWAITVHRAQGSEWDAVVLVLPPEAGRMLSRPLVYTGLTRARRHLSIVHAAGPAVARAVRHVGARPRRTRLAALLCQDGATDSTSR